MYCCSRLRGPGTGPSGERTLASVQAGEAAKPDCPPSHVGRRSKAPTAASLRRSQASLRGRARATASGGTWASLVPQRASSRPEAVLGTRPEPSRRQGQRLQLPGESDAGAEGGPGGRGGARGRYMALRRTPGAGGQGRGRSSPHFMQGSASSCCSAKLRSGSPGAQPSETPPSTERAAARGQAPTPAWVRVDSQQRGPPVGRLLPNRNGSISRNSLHVSIKLTREGAGGLQGPGEREGGGRGSGAGLSTAILPPWGWRYLSPALSGMPASIRAARNWARTPRMLLTNPLESGKRGKPMSG